jgi:protein disulfide-isomerase A6
MMRGLLLASCVAAASAALELTPDTFDKEVFESGKAAFIKFLAPW